MLSSNQPVTAARGPQRLYLLRAWGGYVALFCTRSPKYGRPCATKAYAGGKVAS
jgi:hypothetical protein